MNEDRSNQEQQGNIMTRDFKPVERVSDFESNFMLFKMRSVMKPEAATSSVSR